MDQTTFDLPEAKRQRDDAMGAIAGNTDPAFTTSAREAVDLCAHVMPQGFTADDVVGFLIRWKVEPPHDWRALGPIVKQAQRDGLIVPTGAFRLSSRPSLHACPRRVWRRA